jgi:flagellar biogenesis protein FliO
MLSFSPQVTGEGNRANGRIPPWLLALIKRALRLRRDEPRRLRLAETLSLGERRFVALIEVDKARFLVGGTATSLALLARINDGVDGVPELVDRPGKIAEVAGAH